MSDQTQRPPMTYSAAVRLARRYWQHYGAYWDAYTDAEEARDADSPAARAARGAMDKAAALMVRAEEQILDLIRVSSPWNRGERFVYAKGIVLDGTTFAADEDGRLVVILDDAFRDLDADGMAEFPAEEAGGDSDAA